MFRQWPWEFLTFIWLKHQSLSATLALKEWLSVCVFVCNGWLSFSKWTNQSLDNLFVI